MFGVFTGACLGADLSFRNLLIGNDFGPFDEKSGIPRGDFFFIRSSSSAFTMARNADIA